MVKICQTERKTFQSGTKVGHSDPIARLFRLLLNG